jgi:hypothetical protein
MRAATSFAGAFPELVARQCVSQVGKEVPFCIKSDNRNADLQVIQAL